MMNHIYIAYSLGRNSLNTPFPDFAKPRTGGWIYCGWIDSTDYKCQADYEAACASAMSIDHGELRQLDYYLEGAICWFKEP